jgi:hypothetical protein
MGSGDDSTVAIVYRPDALKKLRKSSRRKSSKRRPSKRPPSKETSQAIAALTDSKPVAPRRFGRRNGHDND